jgi:hypothetical protein
MAELGLSGAGVTPETFFDGKISLYCGDNREALKHIADCSVDSIVTDPPYALVSIVKRFGKPGSAAVKVPEGGSGAYARASSGFMGKQWDTGETAFAVEFWAECLRVLKPGGHVVAFSGTRTVHRMACAIEDAGFEIRDQIYWHYASGFPKSHDVSKGIDRQNGDERPVVSSRKAHDIRGGNLMEASQGKGVGSYQIDITSAASAASAAWEGWGTALKPATEPICLARKPLIGTVATNVLEYGTGALNILGTRVGTRVGTRTASTGEVVGDNVAMAGANYGRVETGEVTIGRWPANLAHDGSEAVIAAFPPADGDAEPHHRFFFTAKADGDDRLGSKHPTVKPVDLMQWLVRLVTPKGGLVLDPFAGTGSTAEACFREGMRLRAHRTGNRIPGRYQATYGPLLGRP